MQLSRINIPGNKDITRIKTVERNLKKSNNFNNTSDSDDEDDKVFNGLFKNIPSLKKSLKSSISDNTDKYHKSKSKHTRVKFNDSDESDDGDSDASDEKKSDSSSSSDSEKSNSSSSVSSSSSKTSKLSRSSKSSTSSSRSSTSTTKLKMGKQLLQRGFINKSEDEKFQTNLNNLFGKESNNYGDDDLKTKIDKIQTRQDILGRIEELRECIGDHITIKNVPEVDSKSSDSEIVEVLRVLEYKYESMTNCDIVFSASGVMTGFLEDVFDGKRKIMGNKINLKGVGIKISRYLTKRRMQVDRVVRIIKESYGIGPGWDLVINIASMCYLTYKENKLEELRSNNLERNTHQLARASTNYLNNQ